MVLMGQSSIIRFSIAMFDYLRYKGGNLAFCSPKNWARDSDLTCNVQKSRGLGFPLMIGQFYMISNKHI
jgi:hypothetical protein